MDFINPNFEIKNKNSNSDNKKNAKMKQDISVDENIKIEHAKASSELLKAYNNVVSFKGRNNIEALCTVHNLNDEQIKRALQLKRHKIHYKIDDKTDAEYELTSEEAVLCAKHELNEKNLSQYAMIKNKNIGHFSVRQGKTIDPNLIISIIKDRQTDKEIAKYEELGFKNVVQYESFKKLLSFFHNERGIEINDKTIKFVANLVKIEDKEGKRYYNQDSINNYSMEDLELIADQELTPTQFEDYLQIFKILSQKMDGFSEEELTAFSVQLAKIQDKDEKNVFKDNNDKFILDKFDFETIGIILDSELTFSQLKDSQQIFSILSSMKNIDSRMTYNFALSLAKMQDEQGNNIFKDETGNFIFEKLDKETIENLFYLSDGTPTQCQDFLKILSLIQTRKNLNTSNPYFVAAKLSTIQDKKGVNVCEDKNGNFNVRQEDINAIETNKNLSWTAEEFRSYKELISFGISQDYALFLSEKSNSNESFFLLQNKDLIQSIINQNPSFLWNTSTGINDNDFQIMKNAIKTVQAGLSTPIQNLNPKDFGIENDFNVKIGKFIFNSKPMLLIEQEKQTEKEQYIVYKGIVAPIKQKETEVDNEKLKKSLEPYANLSPEQTSILAEAAKHFPIQIIEENECIIGKGLDLMLEDGTKVSEIKGNSLNDTEMQQYYSKILAELGDSITAEKILKIMPKDAIIQIKPFTTNRDAMLFSISSEWESKNGTPWQFRIHSQDLKHIDAQKPWIYRLGYKDNKDLFFYDPSSNTFVEGMTNEKTHVKVNAEDNGNTFNGKLIKNPYFQKMVRQISCQLK